MGPVPAALPAPLPRKDRVLEVSGESVAIPEQIRTRGSFGLRVLGGSMFPWVRPGDLLFVRRWDFDSASAGDVILFECAGRFFVHRVLRREYPNIADSQFSVLITKGDALDGEDAPVSPSEFLGLVVGIQRRRRHIDLQSPLQRMLGRFLARVSRKSALVYRFLRGANRLLLRRTG